MTPLTRRITTTNKDFTITIETTGTFPPESDDLLYELVHAARTAHGLFYKDTGEQFVDYARHEVEQAIREEAEPSEYDLGWEAGRKAGQSETTTKE